MAWIEVHQSLLTHRKTLVAARFLGIPKVQLVGHMVALWLWALDNAPSGEIPDDIELLELAAEWNGESGLFSTALEKAGFITACSITNWHEYAGKLLDRRAANAKRMRDARAAHVDTTLHARVGLPNSTQPNPTVPNHKGVATPRKRASEITDDYIEELVQEFRSKIGSEDAVRVSITNALNHTASKKWIDKRVGLRGWLRRDADHKTPTKAANTDGWRDL